MMTERYRMNREDEVNDVSMYQKHNADLEELLSLDLNTDMEELDKS